MNAISLLSLPVAAVLAMSTPAQGHPMGFTTGWNAGGTTITHAPVNVGAAEGDFLTRIDASDYSNWGLDPVTDPSYGTFCMVGIEFVLEDPNLTTAETPAWITGWSEDPNQDNFPHVAGFDPNTGGSNFLFAGPVPANPFSATFWSFTFPAACIPTGQDIFLGVNIGAAGVGEGLSIHAVGDSATNPGAFDNPGIAGGAIAQGSYVCNVPTNTPVGFPPFPTGDPATYTTYLAQNRIEVILENAAGGVAVTATNQPTYPASNLPGEGTPNFLSGLNPDASSQPINAGRNAPPPAGWTGDRIGFVYTDSRLQAGDPVVVVVAFATENPPVPLSSFSGTGLNPTGLALVNLTAHIPIASGVTVPVTDNNFTYTRFSVLIDLPLASRNRLVNQHPTLLWQGFGLDSNLNIHATGLARQDF